MHFAFVQVKAFGDLTVTATILRNLPQESLARCKIVVAPHLVELVNALAPVCDVEVLDLIDRRLPALFDLKKRGLFAGARSALSLRRSLAKAAPQATFVMPSARLREHFIVGRRSSLILPKASNVYVAHEQFINQQFGAIGCLPKHHKTIQSSRIALCPFSRVSAKNIPWDLVVELADACSRKGFEVELLLLEGEDVANPEGLRARVIPRRFDALAAALSTYSGVVSADSLPAHLGEYCNIPSFVVSPVPNCYWLPAHAFKSEHWGVFNRRVELHERLIEFLCAAKR